MLDSAEKRTLLRLMLQNEFTHLIDGVNAVQVAIVLRHSPGEKSVSAENKAFGAGIVFDGPLDHQSQFKSGSQPRHPHDLSTKFFVELVQFSFSVGACCQGDGPVWMQMIHVSKGKEGVQ